MDDGNNNRNYDLLDIISLMSFIIQMRNLEEDKKYKGSVKQFEDMIQLEVDKLHKENDIIMQKLDFVLESVNKK